jgi:hypothetical protein
MEENNYLISYVTCGNEYYLSACRVRIGLEMDVTLIEEYMKIERVVSKKSYKTIFLLCMIVIR